MTRFALISRGACLGVIGLLAFSAPEADAGGLFRKRDRAVVPTTARMVNPAPLGTFAPTPTVTIRGNFPTGGGYSPLNSYGDTSMDIYGPTSLFRATAAPVRAYTRGYDGRTVVTEGTGFSTPNLPGASPVVYPTRANNYYGFSETQDPPWWPKASNWIDQN